jgi:hypothetical protein
MFLGHYGLALAAWMTLGIWLFVPWAWWIDEHRCLSFRIRNLPGRNCTENSF